MRKEAKTDKQKPGIGAAIVVWQDDSKSQLLLGLGHSAENREEIYAVPGGHWESGETLVDAVKRETAEEAGIEVCDVKLISVYEFFNPEKNKSYVTIGFEGILDKGVPTVMEADKKTNWGWYRPEEAVKLPLFVPDKVLIERAVSGVIYEPPA
jgi:ADP-ribose pyrophosphatase YjhB (NUDIX family)